MIRPAVLDDMEDLVRLRRLMFESMGYTEQAQLDASDAAARAYFREALPNGIFRGWLAVTLAAKLWAAAAQSSTATHLARVISQAKPATL